MSTLKSLFFNCSIEHLIASFLDNSTVLMVLLSSLAVLLRFELVNVSSSTKLILSSIDKLVILCYKGVLTLLLILG